MQPMSFTIPHMSHIPDTSANAKSEIYLTLDLRSGFIQVALDHATKQCTFSSPAREGMNLIDWPLEWLTYQGPYNAWCVKGATESKFQKLL